MNPLPKQDGIVICRGGLEPVVADELRALDIEVTAIRKRAIDIATDLGGFYRANMGLRSALNVLKPFRSVNAPNYDIPEHPSGKPEVHKPFSVEPRLRIDVKGGSHKLTHTRYVIHRVKDGITDTFRKLCGGARPSIDQRDPDLHIVVYLDADKTALAIDTSGIPLFKRGYRIEHGLTQAQLAKRVGTSHSAISRIESGHHAASLPPRSLARAVWNPTARPWREGRSQAACGRIGNGKSWRAWTSSR